jgi:hypothetical protein
LLIAVIFSTVFINSLHITHYKYIFYVISFFANVHVLLIFLVLVIIYLDFINFCGTCLNYIYWVMILYQVPCGTEMDQKPPKCRKQCPIKPLCRHALICKVLFVFDLFCCKYLNSQAEIYRIIFLMSLGQIWLYSPFIYRTCC